MQKKKIGIHHAHLEEDAAKSSHCADYSLVDYNRSGCPLLEIVSMPDLRSADEAYAYLTEIKRLMRWVGASNCDMEKGELRVDVNISLRPAGTEKFGTRTEIKNLNLIYVFTTDSIFKKGSNKYVGARVVFENNTRSFALDYKDKHFQKFIKRILERYYKEKDKRKIKRFC